MRALVAGITSRLGDAVARELHARGATVTGISRSAGSRTKPPHVHEQRSVDALNVSELALPMQGVTHVFSCLGASVQPTLSGGRASFDRVDVPANTNLIAAARDAGVERLVYVSVAGHERASHLRYVAAHEAVVQQLRSSGLSYGVLRPTGFFSAFDSMLSMARMGLIPLLGPGTALTNPIDDRDLALAAVDVLCASERIERDIGGPQRVTRRRIAELAFQAVERKPRILPVPSVLARFNAWWMRPLLPRLGDLIAFYSHVMTHDCVTEAHGERTLDDYFAERSAAGETPLG